MKRIGQLGVAMLLVIAACSEGTSPSKVAPRSTAKSQRHLSAQAVNQAGNSFYQVFVNADQAPGIVHDRSVRIDRGVVTGVRPC